MKKLRNSKLLFIWGLLGVIIVASFLAYVTSGSSSKDETPESPLLDSRSLHFALTELKTMPSDILKARAAENPYAQTEVIVEVESIEESNMTDYIQNAVPDAILTTSKEKVDFSTFFKVYPIEENSDIYNRINGKSYAENSDIKLSDLRYIRIPHYDYEHNVRLGELIVNDSIVDRIEGIFLNLFLEEYEIESMRLIDDFWVGDGESSDTVSISHNNSSAFCYRLIAGTSQLSNHALGLAIDINPKQNPYIRFDGSGNMTELNDWDWDYLDRKSGMEHMILKGDICESTFRKYGFKWGGDWKNPIDYQHFEFA